MTLTALTPEQERVIKGRTCHGGLRSRCGKEVALMLDVGPQCANAGIANALDPSGRQRQTLLFHGMDKKPQVREGNNEEVLHELEEYRTKIPDRGMWNT